MGKKFTILEVKEFANKYDFEVLDKSYINIKTKMSFQCNNCKKISKKNFDTFKQRPMCPYCNEKVERALIYTDEYIDAFISSKGMKLINIISNGIFSKVEIKCKDCGNIFERVFQNFKGNPTCPSCRVGSNMLSYETVKTYVEIESKSECKLITTEADYYKIKKEEPISSKCKFKFECKCGEKFSRSFNSFKKNKENNWCDECSKIRYGITRRHSYESVKNYIEVESGSGCKLISKEYSTYHEPLEIQCSCGNVFTRTFSEFKSAKLFKCRKCTGAPRVQTYEDIKGELFENNIILHSDTYKNNLTKLEIECSNGHITHRTIDNIRKSKYTCPKCNKVGYKRDTEQLQQEINDITNGKYELLSEYKTMNDDVLIKHFECNTEWWTTPHSFLDGGNRCPLCRKSKGELKIKDYLDTNKINYKMEYSFNDLYGDFNLLRFDFAIFDDKNNLNILIEYDGEFHYLPIMGEEELKGQQRYDKLKNDYCTINNISLLRIPYWEFDDIENILSKTINKEGYK